MSVKLRYFSDETLHSFIFRVCIVNGDEQHAKILGKNAHWKTQLHLSARIAKHFEGYSEKDFLILMRNSGQAKKSTHMFADPTYYRNEIKMLLITPFRRTGGGNKKIHIRYCHDCMIESIKTNGFGYFKSSWHHDSSEYCSTHGKNLIHCPDHPTMKSYELIKTILKGEHAEGCYSKLRIYEPPMKPHALNYIVHNSKDIASLNKGEFVYISECLKIEIVRFIRATPLRLLSIMASEVSIFSANKRYYNQMYTVRDRILAQAIQQLFHENNDAFISFWRENAIKINLYCGVIETKDMSEPLYIYRNTERCIACTTSNCPVKRKGIHVDNI